MHRRAPTPNVRLRRLVAGFAVGAILALAVLGSSLWATPPTGGPGGPVLVISSSSNPFSQYYAEILRAEGLNAFNVLDLSAVTAATLADYDVVILGEMPLTAAQTTMLSTWVTNGGNLVAMRPDKKLASLLGLVDASSTLGDGYLLVNTAVAPGTGIVGQTMQFHGTADGYAVSDATTIATLYATASTATTNPAVTLRNAGAGHAAAFTYDLARSVVYTRQGNPAWSGQDRDGNGLIRSNDLFFGGAQTSYVDFSKIAIPQADEQQRLLANLIEFINVSRRPLPRFWYFPRGLKAVLVMTGDDHGTNGTAPRFDGYISKSPIGCSVANWECVRGTSYLYPSTPLSNTSAANYVSQGFEIADHITTECGNYTPSSLDGTFTSQISSWASFFPSVPAPKTNRDHCVPWSDYDTQPQVELAHGIRLDTDYYYYPDTWVNDIPGVFTGSGMPMRFTKADGTMLDVYQAVSQMTDESGQTFPLHADTLLDRALGATGYYGAFVANMHTDFLQVSIDGSAAIVASAQARGVPIISARQLLDWLDARNGSTFTNIAWSGSILTFTIVPAAGANGLRTMVPASIAGGSTLTGLTQDGAPIAYTVESIKGVTYAMFAALAGNYQVQYSTDSTAPVISALLATPDLTTATITWTTDEAATSRVDYGTAPGSLTSSATSGVGTAHAVLLSGLTAGTTYHYRVTSTDVAGSNTTTAPIVPATFTAGVTQCPCSIWPAGQVPSGLAADPAAVELGVKFRPAIDGFVKAVRFYKGSTNTGPHIGNVWTLAGSLLGTVTFSGETPSGWQEANLPAPVAVTANTTYVVSYHTDAGNYAFDAAYFQNAGVTRGPLQALANDVSPGNGVFRYGATAFPSTSSNSANYWVDLQFVTGDATTPTVASIAPAAGATGVAITTAVTATFSESVNAATVTASNLELRNAGGALVASAASYDGATHSATLQPLSALAYSTAYTVHVHGGSTGIKDLAGNAMVADFTSSFTTVSLVDQTPPTITARTPASGATNVSPATTVTVTFSEAMAAGTITTSTIVLRTPSNAIVPATASYNAATHVATVTPTAVLSEATAYTTTVVGGSNGVTDLAGNPLASDAAWSFTTADTTAPTITARAPASGASGVSPSTTLIVAFSEAMSPDSMSTSTMVLRNPANSVVPAAVSYNAGTHVATLTPSATLSDQTLYTATVVGGSSGVKDAAGNPLISDAVWSFTTADTTPPAISARVPASGATGVGPATTIAVTFNEPMAASTITTSTIVLRNPSNNVAAATVSYNAGTQVATLTPTTILTDVTTYTATVAGGSSGVKDTSGNPLASDSVWSFTTADTTPPTITARTPASAATAVSPSTTVAVTFSETMTAGTITTATVVLRDPANSVVPSTVSYNAGTNIATLTPTAILADVTTYTATVVGGSSGVKDAAGNPLGGDSVWSFTTADATAPTITARTPASGAAGVGLGTTVTVTFSESMTVATITTGTIALRDPANASVAANVGYNAGTHVATLSPTSALKEGTVYTATVVGGSTGVKDLAGNPLASDAVWLFTTVDLTAPSVVGMSPAAGSTGVSRIAAITATFSEAVNPTTVTASTVELRDPSNAVVSATVTYNSLTQTATLQPTGALVPAALHTARVRGGVAGVKDLAGNPLSADVTMTFTTAGAPTVGVSAKGRYGDDSADYAVTQAITTQLSTNLVVFVHGEGGNPAYPAITDTYGNVWTPLHVQQTSSWPGFLWVFTALDAHGGAGHTVTATKTNAWMTVLAVEVLGKNVAVASSALGIDNTSPYTTPGVTTSSDALLLGAFAPSWPGSTVAITPHDGFGTIVEEDNGDGAWVETVATRTVGAGTYIASWTMTDAAMDDFNFAVDLIALTGTPITDITSPTVTRLTPADGGAGAVAGAITATFSEPMDPATITSATIELRDSANAIVAATVTYDPTTRTVLLQPSGFLTSAVLYTARVRGGATGAKDLASNPLAADATSTFTAATAPMVGVSAWGRYGDDSSDIASTIRSVTTQPVTNLVVYVHGEGGTDTFPTITDTYNNAWTPQRVQRTSSWPGFLWVFTSLNAHGGPGHWFLATKPNGFQTILAVEVTGGSVVLDGAIGIDDSSPFTTPSLQSANDALLLGTFAPGFPESFVTITPANGFATVVENPYGDGAWVASIASRTVTPGTYNASWTMTGQAANDFDFAVDLLALKFGVADTVAPTITGTTPTSGATGISAATIVTATFSEPMAVGTVTTSTVVLRTPSNAIVPATVSYNPATSVATLTPSAPLSEFTTYTTTMVGGSSGIRDVAGNPLAANVLWSFTTADITAPAIAARTPATGSSGVNPATTVTATFSEAMTASTITTSTFVLRNPSNAIVPATVSVNPAANIATLTPTATLIDLTAYTVTIVGGSSGVKDLAGNALASDVLWSFTTADATAPTIAARTPASGAAGVSVAATVTATFSEAMSASTISTATVVLRNPANSIVAATVSYNAGTNVATLTPTAALATSTTYTVTVAGGSAGVKDVAGNALVSDTIWSFTTLSSLAIDATVSTNRATAATTIASPTFSTTAANELILALISTDNTSGTTTITAVTGGSLTWTLVARTNAQKGTSEIWRAFSATTVTNTTVTATISQSVAASITVMSFKGVDTTGTNGSGAIGATASGNANPGAPTATLVTTRANSLVVGVGNDWDHATNRTVGPNQTMINQFLATAPADTFWMQRTTNPIAASGTNVTINDTAPATDRYNLTICEIRTP